MTKKARIKDVAQLAGVSSAAVSYVLNGKGKVSAEKREQILNAIEALDYKPSMIARCLSNGYSKLIGVTLHITEPGETPGDLIGRNPFYGEFLSGLENATYTDEYDILISCVNPNVEYKNWVQQRKLDGIVMLGTYPKSIYEEIKDLEIPVVLTDVYEEYASNFHCVRMDDELGGYMATRHLIELGHKNIAFATGDDSFVNYFRHQGYLRALREAGIIPDSNLVYKDHVSFDGGYHIGKTMMESNIKATAVFAVADIMAIGLMKAFLENNKTIPGEISIIGFDDTQFAKYVTPGLTTMRQDIIKKGRVSAEMIINDLKIRKRTKDSVILRPELIVRESTAPII